MKYGADHETRGEDLTFLSSNLFEFAPSTSLALADLTISFLFRHNFGRLSTRWDQNKRKCGSVEGALGLFVIGGDAVSIQPLQEWPVDSSPKISLEIPQGFWATLVEKLGRDGHEISMQLAQDTYEPRKKNYYAPQGLGFGSQN